MKAKRMGCLSRRGFVKGGLGVAGLMAAGAVAAPAALSGCSSEDQGGSTKKSAAGMNPGTYEGTGTGKRGDITVSVTVGERTLEDIQVVSHIESPVMSDNALEILPKKMLALQKIDVDTVSGATLTSMGLIEAVTNAVKAAGGSESSLEPNEEGTQVEQSMTPGTYTGQAYGCWYPNSIEGTRFGAAEVLEPVKVDVTVDAGSITKVEVVTCTDVPQFKDPAIERIPSAIVEQQSVLVDVVTGATCTSAGILRAATLALEEAGANIVGFAKDKQRVSESLDLECDICIVGGGCSGTMAALAATESGAKVIVLDKAGRIGGKGFCSSGISAAGAKMQEEAGVGTTAQALYESLFEQSGGRANALLLKTIANESGPTVDCLIDHGFEIEPPKKGAKWDEAYMCATGKGQEKFDVLYNDYILKNGGEVYLETAATGLVMEDGRIVGVEAVQQNGTSVKVSCKAAIVGTGGFGGSNSLLERFCHTTNFYDRGLTTTCSGDGISLCESVGAQLGPEIMPHMQEYGANMICNFTANLIKYITYAGFLQVNPQGKRFMNESYAISDPMGYGCAALRVHGYYYIVLDQSIVDALIEKGVGGYYNNEMDSYFDTAVVERALVPLTTLEADLEDAMSNGQAWKAESPEELADAIGFADPSLFVDAYNRYNELCAKGVDEDFSKMPQMMNGYSGTLYAVRMDIPIMGTLGGVKVNERLEALDKNETAIPGLYVSGQEGSGFYSYPYYATKCSTSTYAYTSGRLAGLNACEYIATL